MSLKLDVLARAVRTDPAWRANEVIFEHRRAITEQYGQAANYELVLDGKPEVYLRDCGPKLAYYARNKGMRVASCEPIFMSIFEAETLYIVPAPVFFDRLRVHLEQSEESFAKLASAWEQTGRPAAALTGGAR